jgi:hypothetical protein
MNKWKIVGAIIVILLTALAFGGDFVEGFRQGWND